MQPHDASTDAETESQRAAATSASGATASTTATVAGALRRAVRGVPDERGDAPLVVRALLAAIFLASAYTKLAAWGYNVDYAASAGLPLPELALAGSVAVEVVAGTALLVGFRPWLASLVLAGYLMPTSLVFHRFWAVGPEAFAPQLLQFAKNLAIVGGLAAIVLSGLQGHPDAQATGDRRETDR